MGMAIIMDDKDKDLLLKGIIKKYLKIEDNILLSERLFIAKSILNWIFENSKHPNVINLYMKDLEKYLNGEMELKWINGIITKKSKKEDKNDNKKTKDTKEE
jgi:hypothetical protein